jgi:Ankyrin repeat
MDYSKQIITDIELHSVDGIRNCFENGVHPDDLYNNLPLIYELTSEYTRSPRFKNCVKLFVDYGLTFDDKALLAVLLNDADMLEKEILQNPETVFEIKTLRCAYTPLEKVTLLHICAEFNHTDCAALLVKHGADVNAAAGVDEHGFGAQTPIFHTVNQNNNQSAEMMHFLLAHQAKLDLTVKGIIWGKGYEWETFIPSVNPISYAMMGLLPQMHRDEKVISEVVRLLIKHQHNVTFEMPNIPNKYLSQS